MIPNTIGGIPNNMRVPLAVSISHPESSKKVNNPMIPNANDVIGIARNHDDCGDSVAPITVDALSVDSSTRACLQFPQNRALAGLSVAQIEHCISSFLPFLCSPNAIGLPYIQTAKLEK